MLNTERKLPVARHEKLEAVSLKLVRDHAWSIASNSLGFLPQSIVFSTFGYFKLRNSHDLPQFERL